MYFARKLVVVIGPVNPNLILYDLINSCPERNNKENDHPCIPPIPGGHPCNNRDPGALRQNQLKRGLCGAIELQILPQTVLSELEIQAGIEVFCLLRKNSSLNSKEVIACE